MSGLTLNDQFAIQSLMHAYATAADTRDQALLADCFVESATAEYGDLGKWACRADIVSGLGGMLASCGPTLHYVSNIVAWAEGKGAVVRCYTHAVVHVPGLDQPVRTAGIYDDELVRDGDAWRIASRRYTAVA